MQSIFATIARYLFAPALAVALMAGSALGAQLQWQALPDRERISISLTPSEGLAGPIGRIAPTGVIIPFTEVSSELFVATPPEGARIFKGTKLQGRALVLETQTPQFGYMVLRQTPEELVLDFFHNPLGARWKPTSKAPTTELPPDSKLLPLAQPDEVTRALERDPQNTGRAATAQTAARTVAQTPAVQPAQSAFGDTRNPPAAQPPARPASPPAAANPATQSPPTVVVLPGTPEHAATATRFAAPQAPPMQQTPQAPQSYQTPPAPPVPQAPPAPFVPQAGPPVSQGALPQTAQPDAFTPGQAHAAAQNPGLSQPPAPAASPVPPPPGVGTRTGGATYGGTINTGGLEDIPPLPDLPPLSQNRTDTRPPYAAEQQPQYVPPPHQPSAPPAPARAPEGKAATATPGGGNATVLYVDKDGNPVPPPADPRVLLPEIRQHINNNEFVDALEKTNLLLNHSALNTAEREELLHIRAEMLFVTNAKDLEQHFKEIADATVQAINYNQKSPRNAGALLRLGYMNLKLKNIPEAEARFNMLRRLFPEDENVPLTYYYWGDYYFQRGEMQKAADEFQYLLQNYPNSRYAREGALGLARSFYRLGYYKESFNVVDYIEKRWERFYIEYPPFLNMMGDVAFRLNDLDYALGHYWLYANLEPQGEETDIILTRIGDIYTMKGEKKAAHELYNESIRRFPEKDGALVAMMRLAENGVNDDPTIAGMIKVFDGPFSLAPVEVYRTIITKHPKSSLVPLAEIKLAMWHLWKHEYIETLDTTAAFLNKYPDHELAPKAKEVALQTFAILSAESVTDGRYGRMREIWERYPIVHGQEGILPPESRIALGVSYWKDGKPDEALQAVEPFFLGRKVPEYSEMALSLVLSIYLDHDQWRSIREVAKRIDLWELSEESRQQLDFALALAAENLGESDKAVPLWQKLYDSNSLPPSQMAYTAFFLAREAERQRELEKAYGLGREALSRLIEQAERNPKEADLSKIRTQLSSLMDVAETAGRLREALGFAEQYLQYIPAQDSERVAVRYRMARIYRKQGNLDAWKTILTDIAANNTGTVYGQLANSELKAAEIAQDAARYSPTGRI